MIPESAWEKPSIPVWEMQRLEQGRAWMEALEWEARELVRLLERAKEWEARELIHLLEPAKGRAWK
jgi:hypothetical protein